MRVSSRWFHLSFEVPGWQQDILNSSTSSWTVGVGYLVVDALHLHCSIRFEILISSTVAPANPPSHNAGLILRSILLRSEIDTLVNPKGRPTLQKDCSLCERWNTNSFGCNQQCRQHHAIPETSRGEERLSRTLDEL